jgi:hypothetical protein
MSHYYKSGSWDVTCDRCGFIFKSDEVLKEWTGLIVCKSCFEHRHPQDLIKVKQDKITVPFSRPEPPDTFITVPYNTTLECTPISSLGASDYGTADCAKADIPLPGGI